MKNYILDHITKENHKGSLKKRISSKHHKKLGKVTK